MREFVIGLDFGGTKTTVATATLAGDVIDTQTFSTVEAGEANAVLRRAIEVAGVLRDETLSHGRYDQLRAIGVSTMGVTFSDRVEMAPNVPGWGGLRMEESLVAAFPNVSIRIENDVKSATLAELRLGALKGSVAGIYLNLGTGIAMGLTLGEQVVRGSHGSAGEIGYNLKTVDEKLGYRSGGLAPLEEWLGGGGMGQQATRRFGRPLTARDVFQLADTESDIRAFRDDMLRLLAMHITNTVILWDPDVVVVGGGMVGARDVIFPALERAFAEFVPFPPAIRVSAFESGASIIGAIQVAIA